MKTVQHRFVEVIPDQLEEGIVYISIQYGTAVHKCVCGCGNEVVMPISPTDWKLGFDGGKRFLSTPPSAIGAFRASRIIGLSITPYVILDIYHRLKSQRGEEWTPGKRNDTLVREIARGPGGRRS